MMVAAALLFTALQSVCLGVHNTKAKERGYSMLMGE